MSKWDFYYSKACLVDWNIQVYSEGEDLLIESSIIDDSKTCPGNLLVAIIQSGISWGWLWNFYCSLNSVQAFSKPSSLTRVCVRVRIFLGPMSVHSLAHSLWLHTWYMDLVNQRLECSNILILCYVNVS